MNLTRESLSTGLTRFENRKVLVVGDIMLDAYWWGSVDRISPEAPVPVVLVNKQENRLGGAANVALNLKRLKARPVICAVVGKDREAELFRELLTHEGIEDRLLIASGERPTTVKTRILGNKSHLLRVDKENGYPISGDIQNQLLENIEKELPQTEALVFQDYDKGLLSAKLISNVIELAKSAGVPVVVDPKKKNFSVYKDVDLFKPNLKEMSEGLKLETPDDPGDDFFRESIARLLTKLRPRLAMVTFSGKGVGIAGKDQPYIRIPAHFRDITDVSGAGDTVLSVATLAMLAGINPEGIAWLSNLAGGMVCERAGVVPIEWQHLHDEAERLLAEKP